jgi:hypothetical protein
MWLHFVLMCAVLGLIAVRPLPVHAQEAGSSQSGTITPEDMALAQGGLMVPGPDGGVLVGRWVIHNGRPATPASDILTLLIERQTYSAVCFQDGLTLGQASGLCLHGSDPQFMTSYVNSVYGALDELQVARTLASAGAFIDKRVGQQIMSRLYAASQGLQQSRPMGAPGFPYPLPLEAYRFNQAVTTLVAAVSVDANAWQDWLISPSGSAPPVLTATPTLSDRVRADGVSLIDFYSTIPNTSGSQQLHR